MTPKLEYCNREHLVTSFMEAIQDVDIGVASERLCKFHELCNLLVSYEVKSLPHIRLILNTMLDEARYGDMQKAEASGMKVFKDVGQVMSNTLTIDVDDLVKPGGYEKFRQLVNEVILQMKTHFADRARYPDELLFVKPMVYVFREHFTVGVCTHAKVWRMQL